MSDDIKLPVFPRSLLNLVSDYGMARTDGLSDVKRIFLWETLILGIKDYARAAVELNRADTARLDALEALLDAQPDGMLLLHHGQGEGRGLTGLGLRNTGRTLRQAIDDSTLVNELGED